MAPSTWACIGTPGVSLKMGPHFTPRVRWIAPLISLGMHLTILLGILVEIDPIDAIMWAQDSSSLHGYQNLQWRRSSLSALQRICPWHISHENGLKRHMLLTTGGVTKSDDLIGNSLFVIYLVVSLAPVNYHKREFLLLYNFHLLI